MTSDTLLGWCPTFVVSFCNQETDSVSRAWAICTLFPTRKCRLAMTFREEHTSRWLVDIPQIPTLFPTQVDRSSFPHLPVSFPRCEGSPASLAMQTSVVPHCEDTFCCISVCYCYRDRALCLLFVVCQRNSIICLRKVSTHQSCRQTRRIPNNR